LQFTRFLDGLQSITDFGDELDPWIDSQHCTEELSKWFEVFHDENSKQYASVRVSDSAESEIAVMQPTRMAFGWLSVVARGQFEREKRRVGGKDVISERRLYQIEIPLIDDSCDQESDQN
jgi:hypothetical protein